MEIKPGDDVLVRCGIMRPIHPMNGEYYTMLELQHMVGGNVEFITMGDKVLVVDEDGKLKGKLPNQIATGWLIMDGYNDFVAGDAALINRKHIH